MSSLLVVAVDPNAHLDRLLRWLSGPDLVVVRPADGDALPADAGEGLVVVGSSELTEPAALHELIRAAVLAGTPTLGIGAGGLAMADACGGFVEESGLEIGPRLVAKRDVAENDTLFGPMPMTPDVIGWRTSEITELPPSSVLMAASPSSPNQAFRIGSRAWGLQFHIECDADTISQWAERDAELLAEYDLDPELVISRCAAIAEDLDDVWRPCLGRFAALVSGVGGTTFLPVIDG